MQLRRCEFFFNKCGFKGKVGNNQHYMMIGIVSKLLFFCLIIWSVCSKKYFNVKSWYCVCVVL
jgi:hypothetical protein